MIFLKASSNTMTVFDFRVHIHEIHECCILCTIFHNVIFLVNIFWFYETDQSDMSMLNLNQRTKIIQNCDTNVYIFLPVHSVWLIEILRLSPLPLKFLDPRLTSHPFQYLPICYNIIFFTFVPLKNHVYSTSAFLVYRKKRK